MEDEMNKNEISNSLLWVFQQSKIAALNSQHSEYYTVRKEFKGLCFFCFFHRVLILCMR